MANRRRSRARRGPVVHLVNRRHRRRHFQHNPKVLGLTVPKLEPILFAGAGYVGAHALEYFLTTGTTSADGTTSAPLIPSTITGSTIGKYAVRVGCAIATAYLAKMALGPGRSISVGIGAGTYVLTSAAKEFAPVSISPYLASYRPLAGLKAYRPLAALPGYNAGANRVTNLGDYRGDRGVR